MKKLIAPLAALMIAGVFVWQALLGGQQAIQADLKKRPRDRLGYRISFA